MKSCGSTWNIRKIISIHSLLDEFDAMPQKTDSMKSSIHSFITALSLILTAATQAETVTQFDTYIAEGDMESSAGVLLKDPVEIIRQNRANVHRNGGDKDSYFSTPEHREQIPGMLKRGNLPKAISDALKQRKEIQLSITVNRDKQGELSMDVAAKPGDQQQAAGKPEKSGADTKAPAEAKAGSPERKLIMDAMRGPVTIRARKEVVFTGDVLISGNWAKFTGHVSAKDEKPFAEEVADELEMDFLAILKKVNGKWTTGYYGWSGDISTSIEAREKLPDVPLTLVPAIPN